MLGVPDRFFRDWVDDHYRALLEATLGRRGRGARTVAYEVVEAPPPHAAPRHPHRRELRTAAAPAPAQRALHLRDLRGGGLATSCRRRRRRRSPTARGAATTRSSSTAAPGWARRTCCTRWATRSGRRTPPQRVVYLSSEQFTNEYVESVREHRMTDFRRKFREECDVLLIDDIQFLGSARRRRRSSSTPSTRSTRWARPSC